MWMFVFIPVGLGISSVYHIYVYLRIFLGFLFSKDESTTGLLINTIIIISFEWVCPVVKSGVINLRQCISEVRVS